MQWPKHKIAFSIGFNHDILTPPPIPRNTIKVQAKVMFPKWFFSKWFLDKTQQISNVDKNNNYKNLQIVSNETKEKITYNPLTLWSFGLRFNL